MIRDTAPKWVWIPLAVLALLAVSTVPAMLAFLWERRFVWPYGPLDEPALEPPGAGETAGDEVNPYAVGRAVENADGLKETSYASKANRRAEALGFEYLGAFRDIKGKMYRIRYDFWLEPGGEVLAMIGGGTLASIPVNATELFTLLADGRRLVTLDCQAASELDLARLTDEALVAGVRFERLLERHRVRVSASPVSSVLFSEDDPLGDHRAFMVRRCERLEQLGNLRFLDSERTAWRYSPKAAFVLALRAYLNGIRRVFWSDSWSAWLKERARRTKFDPSARIEN